MSNTLQNYYIFADLILGTATQIYIPVPARGKIVDIKCAINGALATADEVLTIKNNAGSSMGTITITQSGSAANDKDTLQPTSNNEVIEGDSIEVETDGGNSNAAIACLTFVVRR